MNIRLALACTAVGALASGAAFAQQYQPYANPAYAAQPRQADRCDRAHPDRTPYACERVDYYRAHHYRADPYASGYDQGYPDPAYPAAYPPAYAGEYAGPAAYDGPPPPPPPGVAPLYVRGGRYYGGAIPGDTSPGADFSIRLPSLVNIHSGVTAPPNPNNVSDQVPSHGFDYDGVPPVYPY